MAELHIDRAYLSSDLVRERGPDLAVYCKAWRARNTGGRYAKDQFTIDFGAGQLTCPAGVSMPFGPGKTVRFPKNACAACPLRQRCTTSSNGRSVAIHPDEAVLAELRHRQQSPAGRAELRERVQAEHAVAHVGHWQGRRARYCGTRKNLFDLRRIAVVHNLHIIARQPVTNSYQLAANSYLTGALAAVSSRKHLAPAPPSNAVLRQATAVTTRERNHPVTGRRWIISTTTPVSPSLADLRGTLAREGRWLPSPVRRALLLSYDIEDSAVHVADLRRGICIVNLRAAESPVCPFRWPQSGHS